MGRRKKLLNSLNLSGKTKKHGRNKEESAKGESPSADADRVASGAIGPGNVTVREDRKDRPISFTSASSEGDEDEETESDELAPVRVMGTVGMGQFTSSGRVVVTAEGDRSTSPLSTSGKSLADDMMGEGCDCLEAPPQVGDAESATRHRASDVKSTASSVSASGSSKASMLRKIIMCGSPATTHLEDEEITITTTTTSDHRTLLHPGQVPSRHRPQQRERDLPLQQASAGEAMGGRTPGTASNSIAATTGAPSHNSDSAVDGPSKRQLQKLHETTASADSQPLCSIWNCGAAMPFSSSKREMPTVPKTLTHKLAPLKSSKLEDSPEESVPKKDDEGDASRTPVSEGIATIETMDPVDDGPREVKPQPQPQPQQCRPCPCPKLPPKDSSVWPQKPLLFRPTPGTGTKVIGVRFDKNLPGDYLWRPEDSFTWTEALHRHWGRDVDSADYHHQPCCGCCATLPINNANEEEGRALIIDFESAMFVGSLMLRIRYSNGTTQNPYDDGFGFFHKRNLRYQAVVRGRFRPDVTHPLTEFASGYRLERPVGKLPPKVIVWGGIKVLSFFSPSLKIKLDTPTPYCFTPLGCTPRSIIIEGNKDQAADKENVWDQQRSNHTLMACPYAEPTTKELSIVNRSFHKISDSLERARARKKAFDGLYNKNAEHPRADPGKVYTFEFLQHLFDYRDFTIDVPGQLDICGILDGQPMQFLSEHADGTALWSFDLYHERLMTTTGKTK